MVFLDDNTFDVLYGWRRRPFFDNILPFSPSQLFRCPFVKKGYMESAAQVDGCGWIMPTFLVARISQTRNAPATMVKPLDSFSIHKQVLPQQQY